MGLGVNRSWENGKIEIRTFFQKCGCKGEKGDKARARGMCGIQEVVRLFIFTVWNL